MKKILIFSLAIFSLVGCSSTPTPKTTTYLLPIVDVSKRVYKKGEPILVVQPVKVADYLSNNGLAYRTAKNEVVIAQYNLWGEDVSEQISERLTAELKRTNAAIWPTEPSAALNALDSKTLQVNVVQFDGDYQGNATIAGEWTLMNANGDIVMSKGFEIKEPLATEGYPALVDALSATLNKLAKDIASTMQDN
ncbi:PqiC family protein [Enterovibrio coralii]|uniref:ABC-type transport auxiliary lipoprotein component domain-containing protein n=1 Tax=Enterovibrio coralii TaxID=294935 RepID=A0A135I589_9GAMM|nr:PqiC family protein [Enterovibrio coralii]KXF80613.1 hypothetical protein ATN88_08115 [Enterovibrio coralii]